MVLFDKILQTVFFRECEACCFVRPLGWAGWAGLGRAGDAVIRTTNWAARLGELRERGGGELGSADTVTAQMSPVI